MPHILFLLFAEEIKAGSPLSSKRSIFRWFCFVKMDAIGHPAAMMKKSH
jgi:hypothetical protein